MQPTAACTPFPLAEADGTFVAFHPDWLTESVRTLAYGIRADAAFDRMPILADALEEAGCDDPRVLHHCRFGKDHRPDCWVIERIVPSDRIYWIGELQERHQEAVWWALRQGHPDAAVLPPHRPHLWAKEAHREAQDAVRRDQRDRIVMFALGVCGMITLALILKAILSW